MSRIASVLFLTVIGSTLFHHRNIKFEKKIPLVFKNLTMRGTETTFGLYKRKLNRPIQTFKDQEPLQTFIRAFFACKMYKIEVLVSGAKEDPLQFTLEKGNTFGNLVLSETTNEYAIFDYIHEGFDFKLYFSIQDDELTVGFIEYTGQYDASLGQKLYTILLLESCARLLETHYL